MDVESFKKKAKRIPDTPGVYFFLGKKKKILYIGKATSLRDRTKSYFSSDLALTRGPLLVDMVEKAVDIEWRETDSVLEALLLEASLIRLYKPEHNTDLKDDKSFNYVIITDEVYPRVLVVRGKELARGTHEPQHTFGPFPHGSQLREAMKIIRRIFPYRDSCTPKAEMDAAGKRGRACFNRSIGLCPGVCTGEVTPKEYACTITHIVLLFNGKKQQLLKVMEREMKAAAKEERFEDAQVLQRQMYALKHIQDLSLIKQEYRSPTLAQDRSTRIEAYDIAHLRGSSAVGVMVVVEDGVAQKQNYRKFILRSTTPGDDPGGLTEILTRRLGHDEWVLPRLFVVDGSRSQINAAEAVLKKYGVQIPVVGVVKDEKHRPRTISGAREDIKDRERDILLANGEAHRFAIGFHRKKSRQSFIEE